MLHADAWETMCCYSFEILRAWALQNEHLGILVMLAGQGFPRGRQNGVAPVTARSLSRVVRGCRRGCTVRLAPRAVGCGRATRLRLRRWDCASSGSIPYFRAADTVRLHERGLVRAAGLRAPSHFTCQCLNAFPHWKPQSSNIKKQTGLFLKLSALKCVECDTVCVADKILQIDHFILCFLRTSVSEVLTAGC